MIRLLAAFGTAVMFLSSPAVADLGFTLRCGITDVCGGQPTDPTPTCLLGGNCCGGSGSDLTLPGSSTALSTPKNSSTISLHSHNPVVALLAGPSPLCTGTIISDNMILTAAHCFCQDFQIDQVFVGSDILQEGQWFDTLEHYNFTPKFCDAPENQIDVALLKFDNPAPLASIWKKNKLRILRDDFSSSFEIVGFGTSETAGLGGRKRHATLPRLERCSTDHAKENLACIAGVEAVAINKTGERVDTCRGDSGGPLMDELFNLVGITRKAIQEAGKKEECGKGGFYTLITPEIANWIKKKVSENAN